MFYIFIISFFYIARGTTSIPRMHLNNWWSSMMSHLCEVTTFNHVATNSFIDFEKLSPVKSTNHLKSRFWILTGVNRKWIYSKLCFIFTFVCFSFLSHTDSAYRNTILFFYTRDRINRHSEDQARISLRIKHVCKSLKTCWFCSNTCPVG